MQPLMLNPLAWSQAHTAQEAQDFGTSTSSSSGLTVPALKKHKLQAKKALSNVNHAQACTVNGPKTRNNGAAAHTNSGTTAANTAAAGAVCGSFLILRRFDTINW